MASPDAVLSQAADRHLVGVVFDQSGASIPLCTVATAQIDTTSSTIGGSFDSRQALYSPSSDLALGVLNLSL